MGSSSPAMMINNNGDSSAATRRRRRVGLIYDERMCKHSTPRGEDHPENPSRIRAIWDLLLSSNIPQRCVVLNGKEVEDKCIAAVHTKKHINLIKTISSKKMDSRRNKTSARFNSIYFNRGSSEAAYLSAGSVVEVAEKVANGELDSAFAIVRPPGHHAEEHEPMGFCLYNNVAIAASFLLKEKDLGINKILIVDWDVHHGNGTQKMFWKDPQVLFFSVHRYESGSFYPDGDDGSHIMIGEGPGIGYNINVPWQNARCGDADYIAVWDHILIPVAKEFNPDMIIVSAGFDAAVGDPLGECCVTPHGFSVMLKELMEFAQGKVVMALEGGYNLDSLAKSVLACVEVLLEDKPIDESSEVYPLESTWQVIQMVREELSSFWPILAEKIPDMSTTKITPHMQVLSSDSDGDHDDGPDTVADLEDIIKPLSDLTVGEDNHVTTVSPPLRSEQSNIEGGQAEELNRAPAVTKESTIAQMKAKIFESGKRHAIRMMVARGFPLTVKTMAEITLADQFGEEARAFHPIVPYTKEELEHLAKKDAHEGREPWLVPPLAEVNYDAIINGHFAKLVVKDRSRAVLLRYLSEITNEDPYGERARTGHSIVPYAEDELKELADKDACEGREPWPVPALAKVNLDTILDELCNDPEVGKDRSSRILMRRRWRRQQREHSR